MDCGLRDYAPMHIINPTPQDTSTRKVSTIDEHQHLSHNLQLDDRIMVTKENGQTVVIGFLPHQEDTEDSLDMDHKSDHVISDSVTSANAVETKIKLNFSVDRLLGADSGDSRNVQNKRIVISTNNNSGSACNNGQYDCCKYLSNGHQGYLESYHLQKQHQIPTNRSHHERGVLLPPSMDLKAVVRPTPIRAMGSGPDEVISYSSMASSILKFHQHQQQQQQHHHHHHQQQPQSASIAALSSLMAPFNGLKSLQINQQHFRQQANIQSAAKSLDIPPTTQTTGGSVSGSTSSTAASAAITNNGKRKRSWSRAVFSNLQRKGLEIQFQQQKYITKPDRRKLAARLNLTDAQVKVWFQNRRMKWRHTRENLKSGQEKPVSSQSVPAAVSNKPDAKKCYTSSSDSDEDEIDVVE